MIVSTFARDEMIRELREALKFYADEKNYQQRGFWAGGDPDASPVESDNGKIARDALGEKKR
jgi:hypothetical protein